MKRIICILLIISVIMPTVGSRAGLGSSLNEGEKVYTHEELSALPSDRLLSLFIENGLIINERLKAAFTDDELRELFKSEFDLLCLGVTARGDLMYFDLAEKTKAVYAEITGNN